MRDFTFPKGSSPEAADRRSDVPRREASCANESECWLAASLLTMSTTSLVTERWTPPCCLLVTAVELEAACMKETVWIPATSRSPAPMPIAFWISFFASASTSSSSVRALTVASWSAARAMQSSCTLLRSFCASVSDLAVFCKLPSAFAFFSMNCALSSTVCSFSLVASAICVSVLCFKRAKLWAAVDSVFRSFTNIPLVFSRRSSMTSTMLPVFLW
mmetsp:Transcript_40060/g.87495  ORF Transcript_40060/g.87495 Transcript_40060/m.87495 type:complete len:217 (+) Transcript_40060:951-1601(+)